MALSRAGDDLANGLVPRGGRLRGLAPRGRRRGGRPRDLVPRGRHLLRGTVSKVIALDSVAAA